jgi:hypothetical protein
LTVLQPDSLNKALNRTSGSLCTLDNTAYSYNNLSVLYSYNKSQ